MTLNLENPQNWQTRDSHFFQASAEGEIPEFTSAVILTSNVICTLVDNSEARETWNFAGWIAMKVDLPVGPTSISAKTNYRRLWLREKQLLIFPKDVATYQITIRFPKWFTQASVTLWEYQELQQPP